jgi:hypothetical protein
MTNETAIKEKRVEIVKRRAVRIIGDEYDVARWMREPSVWLGDTPLALLESAEGYDAVRTYLFQVDHNVYV